jgi:hypothetical protein
MAMYVRVNKMYEDNDRAEFTFYETPDAVGRFVFNKATGAGKLLSPAPGDVQLHRYHRALTKITKAWTNGSLPDECSWES